VQAPHISLSLGPVENLDQGQKSESPRRNAGIRRDVLMTLKVIIALLLIVVPVCAQAQKPRVTKDDAQKVVTIISGDKAKTQTYCEIQKLTQQMEQAYEKNDSKMANELSEKIDTLEDTLGPEYAELINGLQDLDPEKDKLGAEIMSIFEALDGLCAK
jgi:hypothetical protein